MTLRRLLPEDAPIYRAIRREALVSHPGAFVSTVAYLDGLTDAALSERLESMPTFVGFEGERPVALMGYFRDGAEALRHRVTLINVYVAPEARGTEIGERLFDVLVDDARANGALQIELGVTVDNTPAIRFYERLGFVRYGTVPRGFRHGDRFSDEHMMVLTLDA